MSLLVYINIDYNLKIQIYSTLSSLFLALFVFPKNITCFRYTIQTQYNILKVLKITNIVEHKKCTNIRTLNMVYKYS